MKSRRLFLKNSAIALFAAGAAPLWLSKAAMAATQQRKKILVVIFQRGAVDGLNVVVPHAEAAYYQNRPTLAIPRAEMIDLDGRFGFNPALRSLKPLWDSNKLAIIEAVGSPDPTRSHFDAQDNMETGTPGQKNTPDGWLNRALKDDPDGSPMRAVAMAADLPRSLRGAHEAIAMDDIREFQIKDPRMSAFFQSMYGSDQVLGGTTREAFEAMRLMDSVRKRPYAPANGAVYPQGKLGQHLQQIARLIKSDVGLEVAFTDVGGWDTHVNQANQLNRILEQFGNSLAAFAQDLGDRMTDVTVVTMSEFGRTVRENGNRGTDHGHGNAMFAFGGAVQGGRIYGTWPGLDRELLFEGRDVPVTTDFRTVLSELLSDRTTAEQRGIIFPGFHAKGSLGLTNADSPL